MKQFRKILVLCLACLMVLSLAACGEKKADKKDNGNSAAEIVNTAPCVLQILTDADVSIAFDENGKALAAVANDELSADAVCDVAGKKGSEAVKAILTAMVDKQYLLEHPYAIIRQVPGTMVPGEDFLNAIATDAAALLEEMPVILISAADMDGDGYCTEEVAKEILAAYLPDDAKIIASSVMIDGCYTISVEEEGVQVDYVVSAYNRSIGLYDELNPEPSTDEEEVPEDQQFVPEPDMVEDDAGIDEPNKDDSTAEDVVIDENIG